MPSKYRFFSPTKTANWYLDGWITTFAQTHGLEEQWIGRAKERAYSLLREAVPQLQVCMCLSENAEHPVRVLGRYRDLAERLQHRRAYDRILDQHTLLHFMRSGEAGPIRFRVVTDDIEAHGPGTTVVFAGLERAVPTPEPSYQGYRRTFPLTLDYELSNDTWLRGDAPREELWLFARRNMADDAQAYRAVVSLLTETYAATAFCVAPQGLFMTCYHNLSETDDGPRAPLRLHAHAMSLSYTFAGSFAHEATVEAIPWPRAIDVRNPMQPAAPAYVSETPLALADVAVLRQLRYHDAFLIPCADPMTVGDAVVCVGYPRLLTIAAIEASYPEYRVFPRAHEGEEQGEENRQWPDYCELFSFGRLSLAPGEVVGANDGVVASAVSTVPGFAGAPVCCLDRPRLFVGIHYGAPTGVDYALSVSVRDKRFYQLYSDTVVPYLRQWAGLSHEDKVAINRYLTTMGKTSPLALA